MREFLTEFPSPDPINPARMPFDLALMLELDAMSRKLKQGGNGTVAKSVASKTGEAAESKSKCRSGHTKPRPVPASLEDRVRLRSGQLMTAYGIAHSTLYQRMKDGKIPKPDGDEGRPWWWQGKIRADLIEG